MGGGEEVGWLERSMGKELETEGTPEEGEEGGKRVEEEAEGEAREGVEPGIVVGSEGVEAGAGKREALGMLLVGDIVEMGVVGTPGVCLVVFLTRWLGLGPDFGERSVRLLGMVRWR